MTMDGVYESCGHAKSCDWLRCPNCTLQELDVARLQIEDLKKVSDDDSGIIDRLQEKLRKAQHTPKPSDYNQLRSQLQESNRLNGELVDALEHMKMCGSCGEDTWSICEGGRAAQAALDKAALKRNDGLNLGESRNLPFPRPISDDDARKCSGCGYHPCDCVCLP